MVTIQASLKIPQSMVLSTTLKHVLLAIQMEQTAFSFKPTIFKIN
jgi:hypothetical protein